MGMEQHLPPPAPPDAHGDIAHRRLQKNPVPVYRRFWFVFLSLGCVVPLMLCIVGTLLSSVVLYTVRSKMVILAANEIPDDEFDYIQSVTGIESRDDLRWYYNFKFSREDAFWYLSDDEFVYFDSELYPLPYRFSLSELDSVDLTRKGSLLPDSLISIHVWNHDGCFDISLSSSGGRDELFQRVLTRAIQDAQQEEILMWRDLHTDYLELGPTRPLSVTSLGAVLISDLPEELQDDADEWTYNWTKNISITNTGSKELALTGYRSEYYWERSWVKWEEDDRFLSDFLGLADGDEVLKPGESITFPFLDSCDSYYTMPVMITFTASDIDGNEVIGQTLLYFEPYF